MFINKLYIGVTIVPISFAEVHDTFNITMLFVYEDTNMLRNRSSHMNPLRLCALPLDSLERSHRNFNLFSVMVAIKYAEHGKSTFNLWTRQKDRWTKNSPLETLLLIGLLTPKGDFEFLFLRIVVSALTTLSNTNRQLSLRFV